MFGSSILEIGIGLVFVYFLLALFLSAANEWIARIFSMRAKTLESAIFNLIGDMDVKKKKKRDDLEKEKTKLEKEIKQLKKTEVESKETKINRIKEIEKELGTLKNLKEQIYEHPVTKGLYMQGWWDKLLVKIDKKIKKAPKPSPGPSNISNKNFAFALMDIMLKAGTTSEPKGPETKPAPGSETKPAPGTETQPALGTEKQPQQKPETPLVKGDAKAEEMVKALNSGIDSLAFADDTKQMLKSMLGTATIQGKEAIKSFQTSIEKWFDDTMDRVTGWYKRKAQLIIIVMAIIICSALNVDTITIANALSHDEALRASVVTMAEERVKQQTTGGDETGNQQPAAGGQEAGISAEELQKETDEFQKELESLNLPIGWTKDDKDPRKVPEDTGGWLLKVCGILLTAILISLGAPFWFDLLNKLVNLRSSGNQPKKEEETKIPT